MPLTEGIAGLFAGIRGRNTPGAAGYSRLAAAALIQEIGGRYAESAFEGEIYCVTSGLVATPAAGPLGAGGTPLVALWNPPASGWVGFVRRCGGLWTLTGTTSGKGFEIDQGPTALITAAPNAPGIRTDGSGATDTDLRGFAALALAGSQALSRIRALSAIGGTAAQANVASIPEDLGDAYIVLPGTLFAITAIALGVANEAIGFIEYAKRPQK
jgi:hypothetical protein